MKNWSDIFREIYKFDDEIETVEDLLHYECSNMRFEVAQQIAAEAEKIWDGIQDDERMHTPSKEFRFFEYMDRFIDELEQQEASDSQ